MAFGRFEVSEEQERLGRMASTPVARAGTKSVNNGPLVGRVIGAPCDVSVGNRG